MARLLTVLVLVLGCGVAAAAEDPSVQRARDEVERELRQMARLPPPSLEVRFEGMGPSHYELLEGSFELDGKPLEGKLAPGVLTSESRILFFGIVSPGIHTLTASLVFKPTPDARTPFGYLNNYRLKVPGKVVMQAQRGLVLRLRTRVEVNEAADDLKKRLQFSATLEPMMVARIDDTPPAEAPAPALAKVKKVLKPSKPYTRMKTGEWDLRKKKRKRGIAPAPTGVAAKPPRRPPR